MKRLIIAIALIVAMTGCATTRLSDADRLDLYRAHAGPPVRQFNYFQSLNGWTPLGDQALAVWTRPSQAYLLELTGPCQDLEYAPAISISNMMGRVSARFDRVTVHGGVTSMNFSCQIQEIRPLDLKALRLAENELRQVVNASSTNQ